MFAALRARAGVLRAAEATVLQLEEVGGGRGEREGLLHELRGIPFGRVELLDGLASDLQAEALRHAALIEQDPVDLAVVGLDEDGGVALDAPPGRHASGV